MDSVTNVQMMQLATFFVKMHGYGFVNTKHEKDEIILLNKNHHTYPLIRISTTPLPHNQADIDRLNLIRKFGSFLPNTEDNILDIHIGKEEVDKQYSESIDVVCMGEDFYSGVDLKSYFPMIKRQITKIDNPDKVMNELSNDLKIEAMSRSKKKKILAKYANQPLASYIICIVCVIVWLIITLLTRTTENGSESAILMGAYYKALIMAGEWWRLLTTGLTHVSIYHLLVNMFSLINLGRICEMSFGRKKYLLILFGSVIIGSCFTFALDGNIVCVGLSGGLYGLMGAMGVFAFRTGLIHDPKFRNGLISTIFINLLINFMPNIGVWAHLGGLIGGILLAIMFTPKREWKQLKTNTIIASVALCLILGWKMYDNYKIDKPYIASDVKILEYYTNVGLGGYANWLSNNLSSIYGVDMEVYR